MVVEEEWVDDSGYEGGCERVAATELVEGLLQRRTPFTGRE